MTHGVSQCVQTLELAHHSGSDLVSYLGIGTEEYRNPPFACLKTLSLGFMLESNSVGW